MKENYGGDIRQIDKHLNINNCSFKNSSAKHGGSVAFIVQNSFFSAVDDYYLANISDSQFIGCHADINIDDSIGGAFLFDSNLHQTDNNLYLNNLLFINNTAAVGPAMAIINEEAIVDIVSDDDDNFNDSIIYINNTGTVISEYDSVSTPVSLYVIAADTTQICPLCQRTMIIKGFDLFDQEYIPFSFCLEDYNKCFWLNIQLYTSHSYDNHQWMPEIQIFEQSDNFLNGSGSQNFTLTPGIYQRNVSIEIAATNPSNIEMHISSNSIDYQFSACSNHMGSFYNSLTEMYTCSKCQEKYYRLDKTYNESCMPCPLNAICAGGDELYVSRDHYPLIIGHKFNSIQCSPGSCCIDDFCPFNIQNDANTQIIMEIDYDHSICPMNRNPTSYLCSECNSGYSAIYGSSECAECARINWLYFSIIFILFGFMVCWWGKKPAAKTTLDIWELYSFRQLTFFYQIVPSIVFLYSYDVSEIETGTDSTTTTTDESSESEFIKFIQSVISFINFNLPDQWLRCMYPGMDNFDKLWIGYFIPAACVVWIILCLILTRFLNQFIRKYCQRQQSFVFYAQRSMVRLIILCYAQVVRVSFMLVSCREFPDGTHRMYYAPDRLCLEPVELMWIPILLLIVSVLFPLWALYKSRKIHLRFNKKINNAGLLAETQIISFEFNVTGKEILETRDQCLELGKELKQQIAFALKIDIQYIEISKPTNIKNGLNVETKISVKYAKDRNLYGKISKMVDSQRLLEIVKVGWNLKDTPIISNVDWYLNMSDDTWYLTFILPYKPTSYWYEEFQMFRRFVILLVIAAPIAESERLIWIRNCLFMFIILHLCIKPFKKYKTMLGFDSNYLELIVIYLLIMLSLTANYDRDEIKIFNNIITSIPLFLVIPIFLRFIYIKWFDKSKYKQDAIDIGGEKSLYQNKSDSNIYYNDSDDDNDEDEMFITVDGDKHHLEINKSPPILSPGGGMQITKSNLSSEDVLYSPLCNVDNDAEEDQINKNDSIEMQEIDNNNKFVRVKNRNNDELEGKKEENETEIKSPIRKQRQIKLNIVHSSSSKTHHYYSAPIKPDNYDPDDDDDDDNDRRDRIPDIERLSTIKSADIETDTTGNGTIGFHPMDSTQTTPL